MLKNLFKGALVGAAALALTVPAQAADIEVNLFGASAQYEFWTSAAPAFLASVCNDPVEHAKVTGIVGVDGARDTGIARSTDCQGVGDNIVLTYTTFSSRKGIEAVAGTAFDGCPAGQAQVADEATATFTTYPAAAGTVTSLTCADIDIGASDVAGETFGQESHGQLLGPNGGGFVDQYALPFDTTGLESCRPINVPFAFFAHQDTVIHTEWDYANYVFPQTPACPGPFYTWWANSGGSQPQGNLTRLMATSIFSGQVTDWSDFGLSAQPITVCLRHAGSGTHATLDAAVMRGEATLLKDEALPGSLPVLLGLSPVTYFNKGSSDMMKCIRDAGPGAVGYADADKNGSNWDGTGGSYGTVRRLEYMGEDGIALHLINGVYDFWSAQWLYFRADEDPAVKAKILELCAYASNPANVPCNRRAFWTVASEMKVEKADDFAWPTWK